MYVNLAHEVSPMIEGLHDVVIYVYRSNIVSFEHNTTGLPEDVAYVTIERMSLNVYRVEHSRHESHFFDNLDDSITYLAECVGDHNNNEREV